MKHQNKRILTAVKIAGFTAAAAMLLTGTGCQSDNSNMTDFFPAGDARSIDNFTTAQAAAGARADSTLRARHFDGEKLNSLGEAKLDLMLKDDDSTETIVVYMDLDSNDPDLKTRRDAVMTYLEDRGVGHDNIEFKSGSNPNNTSFAAEHIAGMHKTETGGESSSTTESTGESSGGSSSGSSGMK